MADINIFCDGACSSKTKFGGYGSVLIERKMVFFGGESESTNNIMELKGAIVPLRFLQNEPRKHIKITSDSKYLVDGATKWIYNWKKSNWINSGGVVVSNLNLWRELEYLLTLHKVEFKWVKGHAGHPENEACDKIATSSAKMTKELFESTGQKVCFDKFYYK